VNVVHVITTIDRGGAEIQLLTLAREQISQGMRVEILVLKGQSELRKDFESIGAYVTEIRDLGIIPLLSYFIKKSKDMNSLFHAHLPRAELLCAVLVRNKRFLVTRHNAEPFFPNAPRFLSVFLSNFVCRRSFCTIAISSAVRDFLIKSHEVSVNQQIKIIRYAYPFEQDEIYRIKRKEHLLKYRRDNHCNIVSIGRLVPQKDYPTLLKAIQIASQYLPNLKLSIIGVGPLEGALRNLALELGVSHQIEWLGKQSNIKPLISSADIFLLTSKYEGFGLVLLEAISVGVPIVSTNFSVVYEVLGTTYPGIVRVGDAADIAHKIVEIHSEMNFEKFESYFAQLRKLFSVKEMAESTKITYLALLARK